MKQFYRDILGFPIIQEEETEIRVQSSENSELIFAETEEPIAPVHFAFEVPFLAFEEIAAKLGQVVPLLAWQDGTRINRYPGGQNVYFRDGDGHLLELIAHEDLRGEVPKPFGKLQVLFLREVGLPFAPIRLAAAKEWMRKVLGMRSELEDDRFAFMIAGSAYAVVVSTDRRWVPISMAALKPRIELTYGVDGKDYFESVKRQLSLEQKLIKGGESTLTFDLFGYLIHMTLGGGNKERYR
ncbi:glyoxalase/bleomycin resistance/dioxygenase family protein [Cohnella sp. AR92]|nr:glyoxalase/bleomycin resistance/dioxygenase family protein [Cohnella sp. AR92]RUS46925.1 glyoxalase/bleomycin resistance/dioxygenase family protein [Cohnella sp. AR92]